jgi:hypothetical protein
MCNNILTYFQRVSEPGKTLNDADQLIHGRFLSLQHRVQQSISGSSPRYSFLLFFDFALNVKM